MLVEYIYEGEILRVGANSDVSRLSLEMFSFLLYIEPRVSDIPHRSSGTAIYIFFYIYHKNQTLGGGNSNIFGIFTPKIGEDFPF